MTTPLRVLRFEGIHTDTLGHYLCGLGLLSALASRWSDIRGCWRDHRFVIVHAELTPESVASFLLEKWRSRQRDMNAGGKKPSRARMMRFFGLQGIDGLSAKSCCKGSRLSGSRTKQTPIQSRFSGMQVSLGDGIFRRFGRSVSVKPCPVGRR